MKADSPRIPGGYYLSSRSISEDLEEKPAHYLKLWDWMLRRAFFKDGNELKRGELLTTIDEMRCVGGYASGSARKPLTKDQVRSAYGHLTETGRITTRKTTRGMVITICNYDALQDSRSYAPHTTPHATDLTETTRTPHDREMNEERKEKRSSSVKVPADSRYFSAWWSWSFNLLGGKAYIFEGAKDGTHVSFLLKNIPLEELVLRACDFLTSADPFLVGKRTISMFRTWINKTRPDGDVQEYRSAGIYPPAGAALKEWQPWSA